MDKYTVRLRDRVFAYEDDFDPIIRGLETTRVYSGSPQLPEVIKNAEIVSRTLVQLNPIILNEEWIHGPVFRNYPVHEGVNENSLWKFAAAFPSLLPFSENWPVSEEVMEELRFWKGKKIRLDNDFHTKYSWISRYGLANPNSILGGHTLPDHGILLKNGINKLLSKLDDNIQNTTDAEKLNEFKAMKIYLEALSSFLIKYAVALEQRAEEIQDTELKKRLTIGAANMRFLAERAPENFLQALQFLFFSHFLDQLDTCGDAASFGRIDQLLIDYYERDIENGRLTKEEAFEFICHFIIKNWKPQSSCNMTLGGVNSDGSDAVNSLSFMFLEAMETTEAVVDISVRVHSNISEDFMMTTTRVIRKGFGRPSLYNDDIAVSALVKYGVELEDARSYAPLGCAEIMIPGLSNYRTMGLNFNPLKVLELVLNNGICMITGDRVFNDIPESFDNFDSLLEAYHEKCRHIIDLSLQICREDERLEPLYRPRPWLTLLCHGGIDRGIDITAGLPKYNSCGKTIASIADTVNSLYVLRKLVFEDHKLSLAQLRDILLKDWEDNEALRQYIINKLPRYGQDNEEINEMTKEESINLAESMDQCKPYYGGYYWPMIFGLQYMNKKNMTGASPCGRKSRAPLAGTLQPSTSGPQGTITQMLNSLTSIDFTDFPGGVSNVQECDPSLFTGEEGLSRLITLIRAFFSKGGMELALNFISEETLLEAQNNPVKHFNLMVRLFGLSARFVTLSKDVQDVVIQRVKAASKRRAS